MACYEKKSKVKNIRSREKWKIITILNSIGQIDFLEKVTLSRLKRGKRELCNYWEEKCTRH